MGEDFKAKPKEVYLAVNKLQKNYLEALGTIKQLKKQLLKFNIPIWLEKTSTIKDIPFCYLELTDLENEELKTIVQEMEKIKAGFYFLISTNEQTKRCFFIAYLAKTFKDKLDLKQLALFLRENFNLRGGGSPTMIHGGGASTPKNLKPDLAAWLEKTLT